MSGWWGIFNVILFCLFDELAQAYEWINLYKIFWQSQTNKPYQINKKHILDSQYSFDRRLLADI